MSADEGTAIEKTPKTRNSSASSNKISSASEAESTTSVVRKLDLCANEEKEKIE